MRTLVFTGLALALASVLAILAGEALDLELAATALLGVTAGAVIALVPDATPGRRLAGFALGVVAAVLGYYFRAALTPDTATGRAVFAVVVIALCVGAVALSMGKLTLWSVLAGAGTFAGAFEAAYSEAPPLVLDTSVSAVTTLLLCVALGFLASAVAAPSGPGDRVRAGDEHEDEGTSVDELMGSEK